MPWTDWQFLTVTAAALWASWVLVRQVVPRTESEADPCAGCASGSAACSRPRPATGDDDTTRRASPLVVLDERR